MSGVPIIPAPIAIGGEKDWCPIKVIGPCIAAPIVVVMAVCCLFSMFVLPLYCLHRNVMACFRADDLLIARCLASVHLRRMLRDGSWEGYVDFAIS